MTPNEYDYIIVGAGSAGCVLAHRLTADPALRVLLLEAGGADHGWDFRLHMPAALAWPLAGRTYNWYYESEPEPHLNDRRVYCPRGKVLGGSSSINGMAYIRGNALDYDHWALEPGMAHWRYLDCLPYFKRAETRESGANDYHGGEGPLYVTTGSTPNPLFDAFIEAGVQAGYTRTDDLNGYRQEGFARMDMTTRHGKRCSAARGYLHPVMNRPNLTVLTRALTLRVDLENDRATGVTYRHQGQTHTARAAREVILAGGAINSPQLLMLSGIGPADHLREHDIPVIADLPGVGENLQDHLEVYVQHACKQPITLYSALKPWNQARIGMQWYLAHTGLGATSHFEAGAFIRSRDEETHPNLQYHFLPIAMNYDGRNPAGSHGYQGHVGPMRPSSRGSIRLRSGDPSSAPRIRFNYMSTEQDKREFREAVRATREIFAQRAFEPFRGAELSPGPAVRTDAEIDAWVREHVESAYHPSCSCKMGTDAMAVVDPQANVHGVSGLRVVDASIMPKIASGNLNAPTIMIAEKCADMILGRAPLPSAQVDYYIAHGAPVKRREAAVA